MIRTNRPLSNCRKIVDVLNFEAEITRNFLQQALPRGIPRGHGSAGTDKNRSTILSKC